MIGREMAAHVARERGGRPAANELGMLNFVPLYDVAADRVHGPILITLGPPWPVTQLVHEIARRARLAAAPDIVCFQMDCFQAARLREKLAQENLTAEVLVAADVWDLPARFGTVLFPSASHSDRELKLDIIEQAFHVLQPGGTLITLSEYEKDTLFAKVQKKVFGKCGESPRSKIGMAFWSPREPGADRPRRRHEITFHARIGDRPSMHFVSWPGTFSYGRMDQGSRAMLEVADIRPGDKVLDMGCGNGSLGCLASQQNGEHGRVTFIDSNARAVRLSEINATANGVKSPRFILAADMSELGIGEFDVILANPPYYANSEVARMFIQSGRDLLRPGGRFYFVTRMPVQTIPEVVESFGEVESVENRGFTVVIAYA